MRAALATAIALVAGTIAAPAIADGSTLGRVELIDAGDHVVVLIRGATLASATPTVETVRERFEVMLAPGAEGLSLQVNDATVKQVDIRGRSRRMFSVKLRAERSTVLALFGAVRVEQRGDEIRMTIPRTVLAASSEADKAPIPSVLMAERSFPTTAPVTPAAGKDGAAAAVAATAATALSASTTAAAPTGPAALEAAESLPTALATPPSSPLPEARPTAGGLGSFGIAAIALLAAGALIWAAWRRRKTRPAETTIELIATRSLGSKARIVWLAAGDREIVLAVTGQNVRLLSQWKREGAIATATALASTETGETAERADRAERATTDRYDFRRQLAEASDDHIELPPSRLAPGTATNAAAGVGFASGTGPMPASIPPLTGANAAPSRSARAPSNGGPSPSPSPAISGLLKLRNQRDTGEREQRGRARAAKAAYELPPDLASGDEDDDATWARELLAATGVKR